LGTGLLTTHYIFYVNETFIAIGMIFLGFALTGIVSWMLVQTADYFNAR
jgi:hypothetical protein